MTAETHRDNTLRIVEGVVRLPSGDLVLVNPLEYEELLRTVTLDCASGSSPLLASSSW